MGSSVKRMTIRQRVMQTRARYRRLTPAEAREAVDLGSLLIDTRCGDALQADGRIPGALHIPLSVLPWRADPASPYRDRRIRGLNTPLILLCAHGFSSSLAIGTLMDLGFTRVTDVEGGFAEWRRAGLPVMTADD